MSQKKPRIKSWQFWTRVSEIYAQVSGTTGAPMYLQNCHNGSREIPESHKNHLEVAVRTAKKELSKIYEFSIV